MVRTGHAPVPEELTRKHHWLCLVSFLPGFQLAVDLSPLLGKKLWYPCSRSETSKRLLRYCDHRRGLQNVGPADPEQLLRCDPRPESQSANGQVASESRVLIAVAAEEQRERRRWEESGQEQSVLPVEVAAEHSVVDVGTDDSLAETEHRQQPTPAGLSVR